MLRYKGGIIGQYRLGDEMLVRMPSGPDYALQVEKEQGLLPKLGSRLRFQCQLPLLWGALLRFILIIFLSIDDFLGKASIL